MQLSSEEIENQVLDRLEGVLYKRYMQGTFHPSIYALKYAYSKLEEDDIKYLSMYYGEGMSLEDMSEELEKSPIWLETHIGLIDRKMMDYIKEYYHNMKMI